MDNQRHQKRISKNLLAKVTMPAAEFFAFVQDLAKEGLCFTCNRKLDLGARLALQLNVPKHPTMDLEGAIVWKRDLPAIARNKFQYGVHLSVRTDSFDKYVDALIRREFDRRDNSRYSDILTIGNNDVLDLLDAATADISAEGLYVRTGHPLQVGDQHSFRLENPNLHDPIVCLGEVVAVFEADLDDLDHPYGAGIRIISFAEDGRERFADYLRGLDELFKFHWPPELAGKLKDAQEEEEVEVAEVEID